MISLDTSSTKTGWAYWENAVLKESGVICASGNIDERMELMGKQIIMLLKNRNPIIVVIEQSTSVKDPKTFRMLSEIVGIARGWAILKGADYIEYVPSAWRRLIANEDEKIPTNRETCKPWDMQKVKEIFNLDVGGDDEADAILVGFARIKEMCH